ncbi:hypothetical protein [Streptomyces sp. NPDC097619]|uniref:hypothetical protein n=1 Tax=Streptomyces sp. NPDC097619 TaxID=3157228 RepID=UPI003333AE99
MEYEGGLFGLVSGAEDEGEWPGPAQSAGTGWSERVRSCGADPLMAFPGEAGDERWEMVRFHGPSC